MKRKKWVDAGEAIEAYQEKAEKILEAERLARRKASKKEIAKK
ncbi:TPA: hypothetical protein ACG3PI_003465 [Clostridioides difficile]